MKQIFINLIKRLLGINPLDRLEILKKKGLKIGENFTMKDGCIIDFSHAWHIEIGNNVTLAPRVHILAHDASTWEYLSYTKIKNVKIGNRVFIGAGSIVLPGITIGDDVIVGAGSVVTKNIPNNSVFAGNPARFMINTNEYIEVERNKMNPDNSFGRDFSEAENVTFENKEKIKLAATLYGTAFAK